MHRHDRLLRDGGQGRHLPRHLCVALRLGAGGKSHFHHRMEFDRAVERKAARQAPRNPHLHRPRKPSLAQSKTSKPTGRAGESSRHSRPRPPTAADAKNSLPSRNCDGSSVTLSRVPSRRAGETAAPSADDNSLRPLSIPPHNLPRLQPFFGREEELEEDRRRPRSRVPHLGRAHRWPGRHGQDLARRPRRLRCPAGQLPEDHLRLPKARELDDDGVRDLSGFILSGLVECSTNSPANSGSDDIAKAPEDQRPRLLLDALRGTAGAAHPRQPRIASPKSDRDPLFTFVKRAAAGLQGHPHQPRPHRLRRGGTHPRKTRRRRRARNPRRTRHAQSAARADQRSRAPRPLPRDRRQAAAPALDRRPARARHCLTFTDALHFLRSCPAGNDPLEFIFGDLVEEFSDAETKVLCALTYFTLPAKVEHIAAVAGLPEPDDRPRAAQPRQPLPRRPRPRS